MREEGRLSPKWFQRASASSAPVDDIPIVTSSAIFYRLAKQFVISIVIAITRLSTAEEIQAVR
ncbi:hypothetical protein ACFLTZ_03735 [Chloroflexota bacterium]